MKFANWQLKIATVNFLKKIHFDYFWVWIDIVDQILQME